MKKIKILSVILFAVLLFGIISPLTLALPTENDYIFAVNRLMLLNVVNGDPGGDLRLTDTLTRAEFTKLIVCTMQERENALSNSGASVFSDVPMNYWGNGYISYAAQNEILTGYPNGKFMPEEQITFAQAATVILRMLKYSDKDLGGQWPGNYIEKTAAIGLSEGLSYYSGTAISRQDAFLMLDRALLTEINPVKIPPALISQGITELKYLESLGYAILDEVYIISTPKNDDTLAEDEIRTSSGVLKTAVAGLDNYSNLIVKLALNKEKKVALLYQKPQYSDAVLRSKLSALGYTVLDRTIIFATDKTDAKLGIGEVKTSAGTFKTRVANLDNMTGSMVSMLVDRDGYIIYTAKMTDVISVSGIVESFRDNELEYTMDGKTKTDKLDKNSVTFIEEKPAAYSVFASTVKAGYRVELFGTDQGVWSHILLYTEDDVLPFVVHSKTINSINGMTISNPDSLKVYRDGLASSFNQIQINDVVYYNEQIGRMDVYIKKIVGTYTDALPDKANVERVVVGGKTYTIGSKEAENMLNETPGSIKKGQRITLLLGKNDFIIGVAGDADAGYMNYGVLQRAYTEISEKEENKGKLEYKVDIFAPDGNVFSYVADKDYKDFVGLLVKLNFSGNTLSLSEVTKTGISGDINLEKNTIGGYKLLQNVKIIQRVDDYNINETNVQPKLEVIELSDIKRTNLLSSDVLNVAYANAFKDIEVLYLKNMTKDNYQYGMLVSKSSYSMGLMSTYKYKIDINGTQTDYTMTVGYGAAKGAPIGVTIQNNQIITMFELANICDANRIDAVEEERIMIDGVIYTMAYDVVIYKQKSNYWEYAPISLSELKNMQISHISLYADTYTPTAKVRVIKVS